MIFQSTAPSTLYAYHKTKPNVTSSGEAALIAMLSSEVLQQETLKISIYLLVTYQFSDSLP